MYQFLGFTYFCVNRWFCDTLKQDKYDWNCTLLFNYEKVDKQNLIRQKAVIKLSRSSYFYNPFIICPSVTVRIKKKPTTNQRFTSHLIKYARGRRTIIKKRIFLLSICLLCTTSLVSKGDVKNSLYICVLTRIIGSHSVKLNFRICLFFT